MKKLRFLLILCTVLFSGLLYAEIPVYTEEQTNIVVTVDQPQFIIKLKSNPTTGYSWSLRQYDKKLVEKIKNVYAPSADKLIGTPGTELWTFKLTPAGFASAKNIEIQFAYRRPWESRPVKQLVFNVTPQATLTNDAQ